MKLAASLCLLSVFTLVLLLVIGLTARAVEVAYKAEITGVKDDELRETLTAVSRLVAETERPPPTWRPSSAGPRTTCRASRRHWTPSATTAAA